MSARTLVIVPAFNEERTVGEVVARITNSGLSCLVIDDGSTDNTEREARINGAYTIRHPINLGVGSALQAGFKWALRHGYERVVQCDADGQHDVTDIQQLLMAQESTESDLVIGSRFIDVNIEQFYIHPHRRRVMKFLQFLIRVKTGVTITDPTSGFRCICNPLLLQFSQSFSIQYLGDTFEANLSAAANGYSIIEVPTKMNERQFGLSSASFTHSVKQILRSVVISVLHLNFPIEPKENAAVKR